VTTTENYDKVAETLVNEEQRAALLERLAECCAIEGLPGELREALDALREELSSADWTKAMTLFGILWYKLDQVINTGRSTQSSTASMERDLKTIASTLKDILNQLRQR
jgi:hypothetical protein